METYVWIFVFLLIMLALQRENNKKQIAPIPFLVSGRCYCFEILPKSESVNPGEVLQSEASLRLCAQDTHRKLRRLPWRSQ